MKNFVNKIKQIFFFMADKIAPVRKQLRDGLDAVLNMEGMRDIKTMRHETPAVDQSERKGCRDFTEILKHVRQELDDVFRHDKRHYVIVLEEDVEKSSITVQDTVSGAVMVYNEFASSIMGKWEYRCDYGVFKNDTLLWLVRLVRGEISYISQLEYCGGSLMRGVMDLNGIHFEDNEGRAVSLGTISYRRGQWIVESPFVDTYKSRNFQVRKVFNDEISAWEYSRMSIVCLMHNYSFPEWAAFTVLAIDNLFASDLPETFEDKRQEKAEWKDGGVQKWILFGAWFLIIYIFFLLFATELALALPWAPVLIAAGLSGLYVLGIMKILPSNYLKHRKKFIDREYIRFPIYKFFLWLFPTIVVAAANELLDLAIKIRSAVLDNTNKISSE